MFRWWKQLTGKGTTENFTAPLEEHMEGKRREALEAEYEALSRAAEGAQDPRIRDLAAERRAELKEAEDFHRALGG